MCERHAKLPAEAYKLTKAEAIQWSHQVETRNSRRFSVLCDLVEARHKLQPPLGTGSMGTYINSSSNDLGPLPHRHGSSQGEQPRV